MAGNKSGLNWSMQHFTEKEKWMSEQQKRKRPESDR